MMEDDEQTAAAIVSAVVVAFAFAAIVGVLSWVFLG